MLGRTHLRPLALFGLISGATTLLDFGAFNVLIAQDVLSPVPATIVSYGLGIVASYLLNRRWTFHGGRDNRFHEAILFVSISLVGLALNGAAVAVAASAVGEETLALNLAKLVAGAGTWLLKFLAIRQWVFPVPEPARDEPGGVGP
jgi:putative flippase GtrA